MDGLPPYGSSREELRFVRPTRNYGPGLWNRAQQLHTALPGGAVFVGRTAALLHGADVLPPGLDPGFWPVEVAVPRSTGARCHVGMRWYRWNLPTDHVTSVSGLPVTTLARTAADCARCLPRLEAIAAVDQLLNLHADPAAIQAILERSSNRPYIAQARSIVDLAVPGVASPAESWCRCLIYDSGLPKPQIHIPVPLAAHATAYIDMGYVEFRVGVEYDGHEHHTAQDDVDHDLRRRRRLFHLGWKLVVVRYQDVLCAPDRMLLQLLGLLQERGWAVRPEAQRRIRRRIDYIARCQRKNQEHWFQDFGIP
ncbi:hypothetical protein RIF23_20670 [Lipingzhangella sp. LS1_29]|uniref:Very-short-patch-repair endonuclease n=1 Tax=Lipingzhangella rawalii TaxID=2055835 RepID=A0ABU2HBJ3_9ACTN|nr:hypothetical protein [Lipingzhangella rawalii]MDS1272699.1 hypothetical protein [Lipingzhangella rawalii]